MIDTLLFSCPASYTQVKKRRVNGIIKDLRKNGQDSVYNVQQAILNDLQLNGLLTVEYRNGAKQPISSYAAMAARSARIETSNIGAIGRALENGTDLVIMTTMPQCCKYCGAYQDKVYSISGKDKRFPALFKTVLVRGYALPHPNCRHEFIPYFEEIEAPEDVERMAKQSHIKYDKKGHLLDVRTAKDIEGYRNWQAGNRQLNAEAKEFAEMQEYYKSLGKTPPYTTLAGFRRSRRADELSPAFKEWRKRNIDQKQYDRWKEIIGAENMPETLDKFQEIKYNKTIEEFDKLKLKVSDEKIRRKLGTEELPLTVHKDKQGKHILGAKTFEKVKNRSYLAVDSVEEGNKLSQDIVDRYHGKGELSYNSKMQNIKERVVTDKVIGYIREDDGSLTPTKSCTIHYSKTGTHIVPTIIRTEK